MFGTFVQEQEGDTLDYGVVKPIGTYNPVKVAFVELIDIIKDAVAPKLSLTQRLGYLFAAPGYSHDGSRKNSKALKRDYVTAHPEQAGTPGLPGIALAQPAE